MSMVFGLFASKENHVLFRAHTYKLQYMIETFSLCHDTKAKKNGNYYWLVPYLISSIQQIDIKKLRTLH
jgi:hypothetical protein